MSTEFKLPEIGEGISSADVAEISVKEGDAISSGQVVMELETEKAVVELPCPLAGKVERILVKPGETIQVGQPVLLIAETQEAGTREPPEEPASAAAEERQASEKPKRQEAASAAAGQSTAPPQQGGGRTLEFKLPPLGEGVSSADVAEVLVKPGDTVDAEQTVMELETEKAVVELPSPAAGKVTEVLVSEGDNIRVGQHILTMETASDVQPAAPGPPEPEEREERKPSAEEPAEPGPQRDAASRQRPATAAKTVHVTPTVVSEPSGQEEGLNGGPVPAAPATRRLARQLGVDIRNVQGTGRGGRITQEDVQTHVREAMQGRGMARTGPSATPALVSGSMAPPPLPDFSRFGPVDREAMNKIARTAAENLAVSWNVIPHVTHHDRADITDLEKARQRFAKGLGKEGPKVTQTAIVMKALAICLQGFPKFNSSLDPEANELVYKRYYHIGCAVDTAHGLVVPVIRDCDRKSILDIAAELGELAQKARDRKLSLDAMQGATCTVTNLGGIGGVGFTPIINYPEVCILGMSRGQVELKLVDGDVREHLMLPLSLSYDHRVINGADAARFMVALCNLLSDPFQLLATV